MSEKIVSVLADMDNINQVKEELVPDWTVNDENQPGYIKNKPNLVGKNVEGTSYNINGATVTAGVGAEVFNTYNTNKATGNYSHAEGYSTKATGNYSHAEGYVTTASGNHSHAEGNYTTATGNYSHAEGSGGNTGTGFTITGNANATTYTVSEWKSGIRVGRYIKYNNIYAMIKSFSEADSTITLEKTLSTEALNNAEVVYTAGIAAGEYSHAEGSNTVASGARSHAEGGDTVASGHMSHAEGSITVASGNYSHAEGRITIASGQYSHAEGEGTNAIGSHQHVQGKYNIESSSYAHIVGNGTSDTARSNAHTLTWNGNAWYAGKVTIGENNLELSAVGKDVSKKSFTINGNDVIAESGAEIFNDYNRNKATGKYSHAEGNGTVASGNYSHAEGNSTVASGNYSHVEGRGTISSISGLTITGDANATNYTVSKWDQNFTIGKYIKCGDALAKITAISESELSITVNATLSTEALSDVDVYFITGMAAGDSSHAEGITTTASGSYSHAEGSNTVAGGSSSHAEGSNTTASGNYSHAEGSNTTASGVYSHAEGSNTTASGVYSHAEGQNTTASGQSSHAEGQNTTASGDYSHAEGYTTIASGFYSHAEGNNTTASGISSHAEGFNSTASGETSHAEGYETEASGNYSHTEGYKTRTVSTYQHVQGILNIVDTENKYAHIVGNGTFSARSNAHTLDWNGNAWYAGTVQTKGVIIESSTEGSNKKFKLTIDDNGTITATEILS